MIYLSDISNQVIANDTSVAVAEKNTEIIFKYLTNPDAEDFDIMVDVGGIIYLAPYIDDDKVAHSILDGNVEITPTYLRNTANWCLTFQYGSSFATTSEQGTNMNFKNFQVEASEKAFLFETIDAATRVNVTELYNSVVSVCWFGAVAQNAPNPAIAPDSYPAFMAAIACFQRQPVDPVNRVEWNFTVRVPATVGNASVYVISQMIVIDSNVSLIGDGKVKTYLTFFNTSGFLIVGNQIGFNSGGQSRISDLNFQCIKTLPITLNNHGVIVHSTVNL